MSFCCASSGLRRFLLQRELTVHIWTIRLLKKIRQKHPVQFILQQHQNVSDFISRFNSREPEDWPNAALRPRRDAPQKTRSSMCYFVCTNHYVGNNKNNIMFLTTECWNSGIIVENGKVASNPGEYFDYQPTDQELVPGQWVLWKHVSKPVWDKKNPYIYSYKYYADSVKPAVFSRPESLWLCKDEKLLSSIVCRYVPDFLMETYPKIIVSKACEWIDHLRPGQTMIIGVYPKSHSVWGQIGLSPIHCAWISRQIQRHTKQKVCYFVWNVNQNVSIFSVTCFCFLI